jgi:NTP pyrophosphatase (non-canonical NTP hydrolase)
MNSEFDDLIEKIREFSKSRNWEQFHNPKNLAMALVGEAGELVTEFQWLRPDESTKNDLSNEKLKAIELEIADVQIYLLRLADELGINIPNAVAEKMEINSNRFESNLP